MVSTFNSTVSNAMDFSPYFLMYSCHPHLPIDIEFGVTQVNISRPTHKNYTQKLKARLRLAYKAAKEVSSKESKSIKQYYDHKFHCMTLAPGDIVLVRVKAFSQIIRLQTCGSQMGNQPVFEFQPKDARNQKGIRILHQNMLYLIQSAQTSAQDTSDQSPVISMTALAKANLLMDLHFSDV